MKLSIDDPRVKAYITGELSEAEVKELKEELKANPEVADLVEALRRTTSLLNEDRTQNPTESAKPVPTPNPLPDSEGGIQQFFFDYLGPSWRFGVALISATIIGLLILFVLVPTFRGKTSQGVEKLESQFQKTIEQEEMGQEWVDSSSPKVQQAKERTKARKVHQNTVQLFDLIMAQRFETLSSEKAQFLSAYSKAKASDSRDASTSVVPLRSDRDLFKTQKGLIENGQLPSRGQIQIESVINGFTYTKPREQKTPVELNYEASFSPWDPNKVLLKLTLSTTPQKSSLVTTGQTSLLLDLLPINSSLAIVEFFRQTFTDWMQKAALETTEMGSYQLSFTVPTSSASEFEGFFSWQQQKEIAESLESLSFSGKRDFDQGLRRSLLALKRKKGSSSQQHLLLVTTSEMTSADVAELTRRWEQNPDMKVSALYLGTGPTMAIAQLRRLLLSEGGRFYQVLTPTDLYMALEDHFGMNPVVADRVKLKVAFNKEWVKHFHILGYETGEGLDRMDDERVWLPSGYSHTTIYEITPHENVLSESDKTFAKASLSFSNPGQTSVEYNNYQILSKDIQPLSQASPAFKLAAAVTYFAKILKSGVGPESKEAFMSLSPLIDSAVKEGSESLSQEAQEFSSLYQKTGQLLGY